MKMLIATVTISCALPALDLNNTFAQASAGAAGGSARGGTAVGGVAAVGSAGTVGVGAASGAAPGRVSPTGSLAGQAPVSTPGAFTTPPAAGGTVTPGNVPLGPINPGGIAATPPQTVGRTFDRSTISGGPVDTVVNPAANQPTFRFPPVSVPSQSIITNTGIGGLPEASPFPGEPVRVGNTVGANFGSTLGTTAPRETVAVNLPPGARVVTNAFGVSQAIVPGPLIVPTNSVGRGPAFESSTTRALPEPRRLAPPSDVRINR